MPTKEPFEIAVPEATLTDLRDRLGRTRFPRDFGNADWEYGTNLDYLKGLVEYWRTKYDWRRHEQLRMLTQWEHLSSYIWGSGKARHFFCPVCGVAPLRLPCRKTETGNDNVAVLSAAARPKQTRGGRG